MSKLILAAAIGALSLGACGAGGPDPYDSTQLGEKSPIITVNPQVRCKLPDGTVVNTPARNCKAGGGALTNEETPEGKATNAMIDAIETQCMLPDKVVKTTIKGCKDMGGNILANCTGLCAEWAAKNKISNAQRDLDAAIRSYKAKHPY